MDSKPGLTADQVLARRKQFDYNEIPDRPPKNILVAIWEIVSEPMIMLLMITVGLYFILGDVDEALLLLASFIGIIGIELYQESKTEKSLQALKQLSSPTAEVIRGGKAQTVPGRELVPGDIVLLAEGGRVPADAKLLVAENLRADESMMTGESVPIDKRAGDGVMSGTLLVSGHGRAEVLAIGVRTEMGKIGDSLTSIDTEKTLLQKEVNRVVKIIAVLAVSLSLILALAIWLTRGELIQGLLSGLTLAIAILPEEFPVVLTIFLTLGAWRLARNNVLARRAHTIETLGSATVLCVDKTGTLTENKMAIIATIDADGNLHNQIDDTDVIIKYGVLASQVNPFDPMEQAFLTAGDRLFNGLDNIYNSQAIIREYPLDEQSLSVAQVWSGDKSDNLVALKGAPETVFELCHLPKKQITNLNQQSKQLTDKGLRVLAVARAKAGTKLPDDRHDFDFTFLGLVGLADPIRSEVPAAIKLCHQAGIRVVMITGDHPETALHIASQIGLDHGAVLTGPEFETMSPKDRRAALRTVTVFSRVTPSHKLTIVQTFKTAGEVVAMTGDGVNDAPALKAAHVGIAMGMRGTDVAREAASIVLLDDNFASIVSGIRLGRRIYDNLQKAMSYIIAVHLPIAFMSLVPALAHWPLMLIPAHIVFLEFIIDPSSTIIFENEKESAGIMKRPPRKLAESIFNRRMVITSILKGLIVSLIIVAAFRWLLDQGWDLDKARGMTFLIMVVANIGLIVGISGRQALADIFHRQNMAMLIILSVASMSLLAVFAVPLLRDLFYFAVLTPVEIAAGIAVGAASIFAIIPLKIVINWLTSKGGNRGAHI